jgi:hypothetical protein
MHLEISTELACSPERAWQEVQTTRLMKYVARPLLHFEPVEPQDWPDVWEEKAYLCRTKLLGFLPLGKQWIDIRLSGADSASTGQKYQVRDKGHGDLVRTWDHIVVIEETPTGKTRYTDRLEIEAGLLTPLVWLYGQVFYRHRQRRWRKLAQNGFDYGRG